jgi:acyl dehydratase
MTNDWNETSMQGKTADELKAGDRTVSHRRTITEADVLMFTSMTWIIDPIFTDESFASQTHFGGRAVPGPLLLAYSLGLTEELVYGTTLAALAIDNVRFKQGVRPGTTIHVVSEIMSARPSSTRDGQSIVGIKHEVFSDKHEGVVVSFERQMLVASREFLDSMRKDQ